MKARFFLLSLLLVSFAIISSGCDLSQSAEPTVGIDTIVHHDSGAKIKLGDSVAQVEEVLSEYGYEKQNSLEDSSIYDFSCLDSNDFALVVSL